MWPATVCPKGHVIVGDDVITEVLHRLDNYVDLYILMLPDVARPRSTKMLLGWCTTE